jgi:hypothetical protein
VLTIVFRAAYPEIYDALNTIISISPAGTPIYVATAVNNYIGYKTGGSSPDAAIITAARNFLTNFKYTFNGRGIKSTLNGILLRTIIQVSCSQDKNTVDVSNNNFNVDVYTALLAIFQYNNSDLI